EAGRLFRNDDVVGRDVRVEALQGSLEGVVAGRQQREIERARRVGRHGALEAFFDAGQFDGRAGKRAAGFVLDAARDRSEERAVGEKRQSREKRDAEKNPSDSDALDVVHISFSGARRRATPLPRCPARARITKGSSARTTTRRRLTRSGQEE